MIRAGLVVIVVVSIALLMMVMTADWLDAWPFLIGRARDWWYISGFLGGLLTGWVASLITVAVCRRTLFGPTFPVHGPEDLAARLVGRIPRRGRAGGQGCVKTRQRIPLCLLPQAQRPAVPRQRPDASPVSGGPWGSGRPAALMPAPALHSPGACRA